MGAAQRLDPADDAGAAAERDDRDALRARRRRARVRTAVGVGGQQDRVGRRVEAAAAQPRQVGVAAPGRVADAVLGRR